MERNRKIPRMDPAPTLPPEIMDPAPTLPPEIIENIWRFMSRNDRRRTVLLTKDWFHAWLTTSAVELDSSDFKSPRQFEDFVRGWLGTDDEDRRRNIISFKLKCDVGYLRSVDTWVRRALALGATIVELDLASIAVPTEVLGSVSLLRLRLVNCRLGRGDVIGCRKLKCLELENISISGVGAEEDRIRVLCESLEELMISNCSRFTVRRLAPDHHKIERLSLYRVCIDVDELFTDFTARFPCLQNLSLIDCRGYRNSALKLPVEVLGPKGLTYIALSDCIMEGNKALFGCWTRGSFHAERVDFRSYDVFKDLARCFSLLEDLSISECYHLTTISRGNLIELLNLKRLSLYKVSISDDLFSDFGRRFPCMTDLSISHCTGCKSVQITSSSLMKVSFCIKVKAKHSSFDVPSIHDFFYSGPDIPDLAISGPAAATEWKFHVSIDRRRMDRSQWFYRLKEGLERFRSARIYLKMSIEEEEGGNGSLNINIQDSDQPLYIEELSITPSSTSYPSLLLHLLSVCRPRFIIYESLKDIGNNDAFAILCKKLGARGLNSGGPDNSLVERIGLKSVELYEMVDMEWVGITFDQVKTLGNIHKVGFELRWYEV